MQKRNFQKTAKMTKTKLKKGDEVIVLLGKDRDRKGKIEKIDLKKGTVIIPGINVYKKALKKSQQNPRGGVADLTRPLSWGKVGLICPKCKKVTRIGCQIIGGEKRKIHGLSPMKSSPPSVERIRICRKCQQKI